MLTDVRNGFWRGMAALGLVAGILVVPSSPALAATGVISFDAAASPAASEDVGLFGNIGLSRDNTVDEVTVDYNIVANAGSVFDSDFALNGSVATSGTVSFPVGQASAAISVLIADDVNGEGAAGTETFTIVLSNPVNIDSPGDLYALGTSAHVLTITDDGDSGSVIFSASDSSIGEADTDVVATVSVTRTGGTEGVAAATITSTGGTATVAADYVAVSQGVTFAHGDSSPQVVSVTIIGDNEPNEGTETIELSLSGPQAGVGPHRIDITDDDSPGIISFDGAAVSAFESSGTVDVTFIRTGGVDGAISVDYASAESGGGALSDVDFTGTTGTVTFAQGETSQTVAVTLINDTSLETDETFQIEVVVPDADFTGPAFKLVTIVDDELVANFDSYTTPEDTPLVAVVGVLDNDAGPDGVDLDVSLVGAPTIGTLTAFDLETGLFTYEPAQNFEGTAFFTYSVTDGLNSESGVVRITVTDANSAPDAVDDSYPSISRIDPTVLDVLANDIDQDSDPITILTGVVLTPEGNTVDCSNGANCVFTPAAGYVGIDSFTYTIEDTLAATDVATVAVFVGLPRGCDVTATPGVPLIGTAADEVLCGTPGDDIIDGGGGDDVILGFDGDDILTGGPGKDRLVGGDGDDILNPGTGDNDDTIGGPGSDTVVYYANDPAVDTVVVSEAAISIVSPLGVDDGDLHETVENIIVELLAGNDSITVQAGDVASMDLRGGGGTDRLQYDTTGLTGVSDTGAILTATGKQPVIYSGFEIRVTDTFIIELTPGDDVRRFTASAAAGLIIDPLGGNDDIRVDLGSLVGIVTVTDSGLTGEDILRVSGVSGDDDIEIRPVAVEAAGEIVNFSGIEDLRVSGNLGNDQFRLDAGAGFAPAAFSTVVTIDGGEGTDTFRLTSANSCSLVGTSVDVDGIASFPLLNIEVLVTDCNGVVLTQSLVSGYWLVDASGMITAYEVSHFGDHSTSGGTSASVVGLGVRPDKLGYWTVQANGDVTAFGQAADLGDLPQIGVVPARPVVAMSPTSSGGGYYLLGDDGGVFAFGDAAFFGSTGDIALALPVTAMASAPTGAGYWFVGRDGGIFAYGPNARFLGSVPQFVSYNDLAADVVGIAPTVSGNGYWLVGADGGIFAFGDAKFLGSVPGVLAAGATLDSPVVGMVATPSGKGYWVVAADGGVFAFGDAPFVGSLGGTGADTIVALAG